MYVPARYHLSVRLASTVLYIHTDSYIRYESAASLFQLPIAASPCVASALAESVRG